MNIEKRKILIIEDELALRKDIVEMLTFEGFDVVEAENGVHGVEVAREHLPDLIICDIMMPELNGFEVLEELRKDFETQTIPFIFLTARTDKQDRKRGMSEGADDFLTKPFKVEDLLSTIRIRLAKHDEIIRRGRTEVSRAIILSMPHELRTPLTVILGFSDILMADYQRMEPHRVYEMSEHINKAALRLYHLVENYLVFAQIELARTDDEFLGTLGEAVTTDASALIKREAMQRAEAYQRMADLRLELQPDLHVQVREDLLRKMAEELVDNAFKFSEAGTEVIAEVYMQDEQLVLRVTDHGRGMIPSQIARIGAHMQFDRKLYEQQGSGLGLIICKQIAELHSGNMTIESDPSQYTVVTVTLPLLPTAD